MPGAVPLRAAGPAGDDGGVLRGMSADAYRVMLEDPLDLGGTTILFTATGEAICDDIWREGQGLRDP